jgi:hypothetical protein
VQAGAVPPTENLLDWKLTKVVAPVHVETAEAPDLPTATAETFIADAADNAPATPAVAAVFASLFKSTNFGRAVAARIPKMTITITNSISVKPECLLMEKNFLNFANFLREKKPG